MPLNKLLNSSLETLPKEVHSSHASAVESHLDPSSSALKHVPQVTNLVESDDEVDEHSDSVMDEDLIMEDVIIQDKKGQPSYFLQT